MNGHKQNKPSASKEPSIQIEPSYIDVKRYIERCTDRCRGVYIGCYGQHWLLCCHIVHNVYGRTKWVTALSSDLYHTTISYRMYVL